MSDTSKLREIALFRNLSDKMLADFSAYFKQNSYGADGVIFKEKSSGDTLYIIVEGEVVIEKAMDDEGREFKTLAILAGGDFFGEMAVFEGGARFAQARASRDTAVYEVGRQQFFSFIKEHPETGMGVLSEIMRTVSRRLQHTSSELTMLFDLSRLLLRQHKTPAEFLAEVMEQLSPYLEGSWNIKAYAYNLYNAEFEEAYSRGSFAAEPRALPSRPESGWLDDNSYMMACSSGERPLGCALFSRSEKLSHVEKNNLATIFNTISSILGSAMVNIEHQAEAAMLEKLRKSKNTI